MIGVEICQRIDDRVAFDLSDGVVIVPYVIPERRPVIPSFPDQAARKIVVKDGRTSGSCFVHPLPRGVVDVGGGQDSVVEKLGQPVGIVVDVGLALAVVGEIAGEVVAERRM